MDNQEIAKLVAKQQLFFQSNATKNIDFRKNQLRLLRKALVMHEAAIIEALKKDLSKPDFEALLSEIEFLRIELDDVLKKLKKWAKPVRKFHSLINFPGKSFIYKEPFGVTLIIAPWNYPFQLALSPLIGAIAAGNCCIVKPSEVSPNVSAIIKTIIAENFDENYIAVVEGGVAETQALLQQKFDFIFYTGSTAVGKIVMKAAAENLTPVVLELGGKSPCIVEPTANLEVAARRICWGKFFNAGQTCIAPDYLLVHESVKYDLIEFMRLTLLEFYGCQPEQSKDFARIINEKHFDRLMHLMHAGNIVIGGKHNRKTKFIEPTIIDEISWDDAIMQEEIFGPLLPIIVYKDIEEAILKIKNRPKPLALYIFSKDNKNIKKILSEVSAGGVCINDTISHITNNRLPFGGVGDSGMGFYHGKYSFDTFSHHKAVMKKSYYPDFAMRYPPYIQISKQMRKILKWLS